MKTICAWCNNLISEIPDFDFISHGICKECASHMMSVPIGNLQSFIDNIDVPLLIVDKKGFVLKINSQAQKSLQKTDDTFVSFKGGDVFDCIHASKSERCGNNIHCKACVINNTVKETYKTGYPFTKIPATLKIVKNGITSDISSSISTYKSGDFVFLRIEVIELS